MGESKAGRLKTQGLVLFFASSPLYPIPDRPANRKIPHGGHILASSCVSHPSPPNAGLTVQCCLAVWFCLVPDRHDQYG